MLTDKAARAAAARDKAYKLTDSRGLHLHISGKGHISWRYKYRFEKKERLLTLGTYPEVSLAEAREKRDEAKKILREGRDPRHAVKRGRLVGDEGVSKSFEVVAREWHALQLGRWKPVHANDVITSLERDIFPDLGSMPLADIDKPLLLAVLRKVENRGAIETARRLKQRVAAVYRYANAEGAKLENPATAINDALRPLPPAKRYPALLSVEAIRGFMTDIDRAGASPVNRLAARILALTAQRPGMVRFMEWNDITGIDWADPEADSSDALWTVPAEKIKQELHLRSDEAFSHPIPLSKQAVDALRAVRWLTGRSSFAFPGARSGTKPISENAIGYLYNREGYKGRHVPHGWRSSFSTIMNEQAERELGNDVRLLADRMIIDLMLAHTPKGMSASELRYNRAAYKPRRRELAQRWADMIMEGAIPPEEVVDSPRRKRR
ncbi:integrase arm-type DNA-binding domain-containing protein [Erythrobacter vulgaris]|uniref:Integrase arm-type DNA-binding domain-containing protein n=1 Tax=Qipengyuania vulgaris TaxID=291985 RepID=A0A844XVT6_9SPHN|nr:integrase arm-type DNA-binding domain-containing protein [Qipengyuania vulgaris]MXO48627.1 integrase arm-type DNA-binding domain-containing protein [Qipengyuania vulgaris]MXO49278.1 integrase arm-type DNA-binding domain-containing protein [Qipengyuania vulgaris]MXO49387.1 integrase arm-type DNA-binding domain-containing protein [Qipengyuania vulgaris]MXO49654.1 integrase arm-type DNA-binding domain-containing protein [Qipengyuania vulgaris]